MTPRTGLRLQDCNGNPAAAGDQRLTLDTLDSLFQAILADRSSIDARLVYADALEESATSAAARARAEFIRLQCWLEQKCPWLDRMPEGQRPDLRYVGSEVAEMCGKARHLLNLYRGEWLAAHFAEQWFEIHLRTAGFDVGRVIHRDTGNPSFYPEVKWSWHLGWPDNFVTTWQAWEVIGDHLYQTTPVREFTIIGDALPRIRWDAVPHRRRQRASIRVGKRQLAIEVSKDDGPSLNWDAMVLDRLFAFAWPGLQWTHKPDGEQTSGG